MKAWQPAIITMARYEAEAKIKARKRMLLGTNQQQQDPTPHVKEGKGESAAIIAKKAGIST